MGIENSRNLHTGFNGRRRSHVDVVDVDIRRPIRRTQTSVDERLRIVFKNRERVMDRRDLKEAEKKALLTRVKGSLLDKEHGRRRSNRTRIRREKASAKRQFTERIGLDFLDTDFLLDHFSLDVDFNERELWQELDPKMVDLFKKRHEEFMQVEFEYLEKLGIWFEELGDLDMVEFVEQELIGGLTYADCTGDFESDEALGNAFYNADSCQAAHRQEMRAELLHRLGGDKFLERTIAEHCRDTSRASCAAIFCGGTFPWQLELLYRGMANPETENTDLDTSAAYKRMIYHIIAGTLYPPVIESYISKLHEQAKDFHIELDRTRDEQVKHNLQSQLGLLEADIYTLQCRCQKLPEMASALLREAQTEINIVLKKINRSKRKRATAKGKSGSIELAKRQILLEKVIKPLNEKAERILHELEYLVPGTFSD